MTKILFLFLLFANLSAGIINFETSTSPQKAMTLKMFKEKQKEWGEAVDEYQKQLIQKAIMIVARIGQLASILKLTEKSLLENESIYHNLRGASSLLGLKIDALEIQISSVVKDLNATK